MMFAFLTADRQPCPPDQAPVFFGFECPKNPGQMCTGLRIRDAAARNPHTPTWTWDGNRESPTFSPSIDCRGCSHGFIEHGAWRNG